MIHDIDGTKKAFEGATQIDGKDTEYRVRGKAHLRLIVYQTRKALLVRKCWQGKRYSKTVGTFPTGYKNFERLANAYCEVIEAGELNKLANRVSLDRFFDRVYIELAKKNLKSWKSNLQRYNDYVRPVIGSMLLPDIGSYYIQACLNALPERLSDSTHDLVRALLSVIFSLAERYELIIKNPVKVIAARNNCKVNRRLLTDGELEAFIKACLVECDIKGDNFSFHAMCLLLMMFTGMRIGNCCSIRKNMISADQTCIYLPETKQGEPQTIYLSKQAQWVVKTAYSASWNEYLFPSAIKKTSSIAYPRSVFVRICKRAGIAVRGSDHPIQVDFPIEPFNMHVGRKVYCNHVLKATGNIQLASSLLGHSSVAVTEKFYAFYHDSRLSGVVDQVSDSLLEHVPDFPS
jgi:integrase